MPDPPGATRHRALPRQAEAGTGPPDAKAGFDTAGAGLVGFVPGDADIGKQSTPRSVRIALSRRAAGRVEPRLHPGRDAADPVEIRPRQADVVQHPVTHRFEALKRLSVAIPFDPTPKPDPHAAPPADPVGARTPARPGTGICRIGHWTPPFT